MNIKMKMQMKMKMRMTRSRRAGLVVERSVRVWRLQGGRTPGPEDDEGKDRGQRLESLWTLGA